jgi:Zn-dependent peptidase ImmA (M78 family)
VRSLFGPANIVQERRADRLAAMLLLDEAEVIEAEALREGHLESMAHDLDVTLPVLELWRSLASVGALALA